MALLGRGQGSPGRALGTAQKVWEGKLRHSSLVLQDYLRQPEHVWWQAEHLDVPKLRLVPLQAVISPTLEGDGSSGHPLTALGHPMVAQLML